MRNKIIILLVVVAICGAAAKVFIFTSPKDYLPKDATEIHESYLDIFPDSSYILRAKIPKESFQDFVRKLNLDKHTDKSKYTDDTMWLNWDASMHKEAWWNPSNDLSNTYVSQEGNSWSLAKFENGILYYKSWSH